MIAAAWQPCSELGCDNRLPVDVRRLDTAQGWLCSEHEDRP